LSPFFALALLACHNRYVSDALGHAPSSTHFSWPAHSNNFLADTLWFWGIKWWKLLSKWWRRRMSNRCIYKIYIYKPPKIVGSSCCWFGLVTGILWMGCSSFPYMNDEPNEL
jgi:hypothetical protein